jgi:phosphoribosylformimino-5-aminoimidazole carboxamide ribotide isomerase
VEIIPSIDIKNGRCVRLFQGDYARVTVYDESPVAVARHWVEQGATRLHVVDLDGARAGRPVHVDVIAAIVRAAPVPVQIGGGLRSEADVEQMLGLGAARLVLGTAAVRSPELVARLAVRYPDAILVGVDARDGVVATDGWVESGGLRAADLARQMHALGVRRIAYTDISRDGTLSEPNFDAVAQLIWSGGPVVIASGGIASIDQLERLAAIGCEGSIVGRALYTGAIRLQEAARALAPTEAL